MRGGPRGCVVLSFECSVSVFQAPDLWGALASDHSARRDLVVVLDMRVKQLAAAEPVKPRHGRVMVCARSSNAVDTNRTCRFCGPGESRLPAPTITITSRSLPV